MNQTTSHYSTKKCVFFQPIYLYILRNNLSCGFSRSTPTYSDLTPIYLNYSPYYITHMSTLCMLKPLSLVYTICSLSLSLSLSLYIYIYIYIYNVFTSNFILYSLTTHPTQHPCLYYIYFMFVLVLYRPTLCSVQRHWSYCCMIKNSPST